MFAIYRIIVVAKNCGLAPNVEFKHWSHQIKTYQEKKKKKSIGHFIEEEKEKSKFFKGILFQCAGKSYNHIILMSNYSILLLRL